MEYVVSTLEGALLDAAVAMAEGLPYVIDTNEADGSMWVMAARPGYHGPDDLGRRRLDRTGFEPSTEWLHGGPIIERERISVIREWSPDCWWAALNVEVGPHERAEHRMSGATPLVAAMRAYVASKFGDEVCL